MIPESDCTNQISVQHQILPYVLAALLAPWFDWEKRKDSTRFYVHVLAGVYVHSTSYRILSYPVLCSSSRIRPSRDPSRDPKKCRENL